MTGRIKTKHPFISDFHFLAVSETAHPKKSYFDLSGSCHLDIGVECQIFVIVIFFNCERVLQFGAHSRYHKGALTHF